MVARRSTPLTIEITELDGPLADALRDAAQRDQPVQLTDGGRPLSQITPIRPLYAMTPDTSVAAVDAESSVEEQVAIEEGRRLLAEASAARRATTGPYIFDPVENESVLEQRSRLIEQLRGAFPEGVDAVELIREQRRGHWER